MKKWKEARNCLGVVLRLRPDYKEAERNLEKLGLYSTGNSNGEVILS